MVAALNICCVEIGRLSEREGNGIVLTRYTVSHTDQIDTERERVRAGEMVHSG